VGREFVGEFADVAHTRRGNHRADINGERQPGHGQSLGDERADAEKPHMGLHTWKDAPNGKIKKSDVSVAKNYLTEDEMKSMELIVSAYLDLAENRARRHIPMTMEDWAKRLDIYLQADDLEVLKDAGKISAQLAKMHAETEFEKYRVVQDRLYQSDFDRYLEETISTE